MKTIIFILFFFTSLISNAQWATFTPVERSFPNQSNVSQSNSITSTRTTAYVLNLSGEVEKKFQIKIEEEIIGGREYYKVVAFYQSNGFTNDGWIKTSVNAHQINSTVAFNRLEKVAYANFTYYAYINGDKIWFNP